MPQHQTQHLCDAFHGGGEVWEAVEALIRVQDRLWEMYCDEDGHTPRELAVGQAYDIVRDLRQSFEDHESEDDAGVS